MLGFRFDKFAGWSSEDFRAFEEAKWSSNRFNLERMKTRAKLDALGRELASAVDWESMGLAARTTLDHPHVLNRNRVEHCWFVIDRPDPEKAELVRIMDREISTKDKIDDPVPEHHFLLVGVGIDSGGVEVFLRLHASASLDRRNWSARIGDPAEQTQFAALVARLPSSLKWTADTQEIPPPSRAELVPAFKKTVDTFTNWLALSHRLPAMPCDDPDGFTAEAVEQLRSLLALWQFVAWTRSNDRIKLRPAMKEEKKTKAKRQAGFDEGDSVAISGGLLAGKVGKVTAVDSNGRVKVQVGRITIDMDPKLLKKQS